MGERKMNDVGHLGECDAAHTQSNDRGGRVLQLGGRVKRRGGLVGCRAGGVGRERPGRELAHHRAQLAHHGTQVARHRTYLARGYRNRDNYRLRMLLAAGGLTP